MSSNRVLHQASYAIALVASVFAGCNNIVGLDKIQVSDDLANPAGGSSGSASSGAGSSSPNGGDAGMVMASGGTGNSGGGDAPASAGEGGTMDMPGDCTTNKECTDRAEAEDMGIAGAAAETEAAASICVKTPIAHCVRLRSPDCGTVTGNYLDSNAIVIGSLFSTKGATAATNLPRQQSAELAVEQINAAGGIPSNSTSANGRSLVMVSCDESTDLIRAATHLVADLHVPAIVGPNTSQDTLDVSTKVTVPGGTVVMSPTGVASSIASLSDNDLTWLMVPSDVQRAPLMISQIGALEQTLKVDRAKDVLKLGVLFRNDALGIGTRTSLNDLVFNGASLASSINLNNNVQIDPYTGTDATQATLVAKYTSFAPDIIVLGGTAEAVTKLMQPIEAAWTAPYRPYYLLIDSTKVPELLTALTNNEPLRARVRGTGITPGPTGKNTPGETFNGFVLDYNVRYGAAATISGMGPSHDAAYAIGLALAATRTQEISGASVAQGLRKLAGGATILEANGTNVLAAFQKLSSGEKITAVGTFGMLDWDANGAVQGGTLEMWCVSGPATKPVYASSGLMFDIKSQTKSGAYVQCP
jgi:branched-chain amino acid transport system substrate-binding protein